MERPIAVRALHPVDAPAQYLAVRGIRARVEA
jgi:hypothetical protein